ncbi:MAG: hypothetical protein A3E88_02610 [Legionellales bacterium RIFCSPHIGHO2_12_FULL_35_11]|nr:MAG: hypothetical protein A3E88_02610 [Legionellales bacterium RIFCSPHIGHO2_12_FULL_35_11]
MKNQNIIKLIGYASGVAANNVDCALGPWYLYYHQHLFKDLCLKLQWESLIEASALERGMQVMPVVLDIVTKLGKAIIPLAKNSDQFCVFGGDHSSAIGTWSAVAHANRERGDIGLIWIDAHMDCHTPYTSETKNIHGMPLAHLLGEGNESLINIFDNFPAFKPENVCLIGVRSYEDGEALNLERMGVKVYKMPEVKSKGLMETITEASKLVSKNTCGFGISLDLDGIDPLDAPGVGCPVPNGINGRELVKSLTSLNTRDNFLGLEIVEYNPIEDVDGKTVKLAVELFNAVFG